MNKRMYLVLCLLIGVFINMAIAQNELPPYINYYSTNLNAFVIERADGSDSRVLGSGITPSDERAYPYPGWSPSGEWFVWVSSNPAQGLGRHPWGVSVDGTQRLTLLDNIEHVRSIVWSPVEDLLFLIERSSNRASLIDIPASRIVTSFEMNLAEESDISGASWTPDGQYVTFYYGMYPENDFRLPRQEFLRIVSRDGESSDIEISALGYESIYRTQPIYSRDSWLLYATPDRTKLIVDNFHTGEKREFDVPSGEIHEIEWSASGNYAVLFVWTPCDIVSNCPYSLWLLSPSTGFLREIAQNVYHVLDYDENSFWSPTQDTAAFSTFSNTVHLLEAESLEITDIELPPSDQPSVELPANLRLYWFPSGNRLLIPGIQEEGRGFAYEYNLEMNRVLFRPFDGLNPLISIDGRYFTNFASEPAIFELGASQPVLIPRHSGTYYFNSGVALYNASWHSTEHWLLTGVAHVPFSTHLPTSVVNADGTFQRELGNCYSCVAWLPAQVNPAALPSSAVTSVIPSPERIFDTGAWVEGLSWSPDGKRLAVVHYSFVGNDEEQLEIQEWELSSQEATLLLTLLVPRLTPTSWQEVEENDYTLLPDESGDNIELMALGTASETQILAVSPNHNLAVVRDENSLLGIRDETSNELLYLLPLIPASGTSRFSAVFSPDGSLIVGYGPYSQVHIWDAVTGELLTVLNVFSNAVAFSPDGKWLATGMATSVALWAVNDIRSQPVAY